MALTQINSSIVTDFMRNLPEKFPACHKPYVEQLANDMYHRAELIIDFNGLQATIDPAQDPAVLQENQGDDDKVNYEMVLSTYFATHGSLANLLSFKLRGFERASLEFPLAEGIRQLNSLTELDLAGNKLSREMQESLQLWAITELKTLKLDSTGLTQLPSSVGRLRKLETLSLSKNSLSTLPVTLRFCQSITYLNLSKNNFNALPGMILELKNLKDLRRLENPLKERYNGFAVFPHLVKSSMKGSKKTNADSLQALCTKTIMTCNVDYWSQSDFPPLQCKMLDSFAPQYTYCEYCHDAINTIGDGWSVITVMVPKFADLHNVPFKVDSCSKCCDELTERLTERQKVLAKEIDDEYERNMEKAMEDEGMANYKAPVLAYLASHNRRARRRDKKCTIM